MIYLTEKKAETLESRQAPQFTKEQILASARYQNRRDLVNALLNDGKGYTMEAVDRMIDNFMKGRVK